MSIINLVSVSGGKDSTALALFAIERGAQNLMFVFADTGHEHATTYRYVKYLDQVLRKLCGVGITTVKAEFSRQIEGKREYIQTHWREELIAGAPGKWQAKDGVRKLENVPDAPELPPELDEETETEFYRWIPPINPMSPEQADDKIERALAVLVPTGNPMLDLSLWKGRFASTRRRFCSEQLKHVPIDTQVIEPLMNQGHTVISWQGVRRDESPARANLLEKDVELGSWDPEPVGLLIYRPLLDWTAEQVFDFHRKHSVMWNPLYEHGMSRVGCMPCIHAGKEEMRKIASRFPEEIDRVADWEIKVSAASKRDCSTFMDARITAKFLGTGKANGDLSPQTHGIKTFVEWAMTSRGGKQMDLINLLDVTDAAPTCSSIYGLCE